MFLLFSVRKSCCIEVFKTCIWLKDITSDHDEKNATEVDFFIFDGLLFQALAPAYLIDRRPYCKVFLRIIKISPLVACRVSCW